MKWLGLASEEKEPLALDDGNFQSEVMRSDLPVLLDVWSPGCAPCVALAPTVKRLAAKYDGQVKVCHLDASQAPKTMKRLRVRGTPTVLFIKRGAVKETVVGLRGQHYYEEIIEEDLLERAPEAASA
jgi:thioredoxin-like negative regulator of GroEL